MYKTFSMELAGRTLSVDIGRVAAQANGAAFMHYGDTVVLSTATASEKPREGIDFFPLSVEYNEKMYAVGKIPGGFTRREGKPSDNAILTCRVIDRPMRPLFPKDYRNDVTLENLVMCVDQDCSPELTAMLGAAIVTITGNREAFIENYKGILEYTTESIVLQGKNAKICFEGSSLSIDYYTNEDMKISGKIDTLRYI